MKVAAALAFVFSPIAAWAQGPNGLDLEGVQLDGQGVLSSKSSAPDPKLAELRKKAIGKEKEGELCYISLPRLFAEARKLIDAGQPLPDNLRYLGGMVKLQYIFVYPEEGDIVIAGPSEPFDSKASAYRPLGQTTGRPVLQLDDLVSAMRACGPGRSARRIGCDILITQEIADRVNKKVEEVSGKLGAGSMKAQEAADAIAAAGDTQPVKTYGVDAETRFAMVCVEADYRLKQLGLDLFKTPVKAVKSYFSLLSRPEQHHRFSLESEYEAIVAAPDGNAFELKGPSLKVNGGILRLSGTESGEASPAAKKYIDACNKHFADLCGYLTSWADLQNLGDLVVLAALAGKENLHTKARWDIAWLMDPKGYPVAKMSTPKSAKVVCATRNAGGMILFTSGGVGLWPEQCMAKKVEDAEGTLKGKARRPDGSLHIPTRPGK